MRPLIVTENMSLDGVIAPMDGWFDPNAVDEDLTAVSVEHREAADALVLGRVTYEEFAGSGRPGPTIRPARPAVRCARLT